MGVKSKERTEKRGCSIPVIRVDDELYLALADLAARDDRTFTDYCRTVLQRHAFGHARSVDQRDDDG